MDATQHLEKLIQDLEAEQARTAQLLGDLRAALAKARNGSSTASPSPPPRKTAPGVFQRKYDMNARELIARVLQNNKKALHVGQILEKLQSQGYEFIKATISLGLKQLEKEKKVRRVKAPSGSGFSHAFLWVPERSQGGEEPKTEAEFS